MIEALILALDTSTEQASVAVAQGQRTLSEWSWVADRNHSRQLFTVIRHILDVVELQIVKVDALVVATGPGSFNGLRVGISAAKGLATARHVPLVGISTLDVIAFQAASADQVVWAVMPAGRGEVYLARYAGDGEKWRRTSDYLIMPVDEAASAVGAGGLVAGTGAALVCRSGGSHTSAGAPEHRAPSVRRAGYLAELGRRYLQAGGRDQLLTLEPLYLRRPSAEEKRAAAHQE
jgi:tRNA threonylcarbamoyladenosine biosynthesis protein TsaB